MVILRIIEEKITLLLGRQNRHALCVSETEAVFASVFTGKKGHKKISILGHQELKDEEKPDVRVLVAGIGRQQSKVSLVLPLKDFEIVSISVPAVSPEGISKLLPYRLSKVLDVPVTDYIYDYQIIQKLKEKYELRVYLFPTSRFNQLKSDLKERQKEIVWFEPDVFAACSYIYSKKSVSNETTFLCLLIWRNSVSFAVCENEDISFVRTVDMQLPVGQPDLSKSDEEVSEQSEPDMIVEAVKDQEEIEGSDEEENEKIVFLLEEDKDLVEDEGLVKDEKQSAEVGSFFEDNESADILVGFGLQQSLSNDEDESELEVVEKEQTQLEHPITQEDDPWEEYLNALNLEIMRTSDYHTSVMKGNPLQDIFIGGDIDLYDAMEEIVQANNFELKRFSSDFSEERCSATLSALCIGTLER